MFNGTSSIACVSTASLDLSAAIDVYRETTYRESTYRETI